MEITKKINKRQSAIKQLISSHEIEDQQTLIKLIKKHYGLQANQSIVSRDLRALGIGKRAVNDKMTYELYRYDASQEILRLAIRDIQYNEALIVIHTLPGLAGFIADFIDIAGNKNILGTISGENVVFITPTSTKKITAVYKQLCALVSFKHVLNKSKEL